MARKVASHKSPTGSNRTTNSYSQNWVKWVVIYLLVGGLIYLAIYALFFQKGTYSSDTGNTTQQTSTYP